MLYLEIILASSFVLFLLSSLVSGINEIWAMLLNKRGRELQRAIRLAFPELDDELMRRFYEHPLISPSKEIPKSDSIRGLFLKIINFFKANKYQHDFLPSYIDSKLFSRALADIMVLGKELSVSSSEINDWDRKLLATLDALDETNFTFFHEMLSENGFFDDRAKDIWTRLKDKSGEDFYRDKEVLLNELRESIKSKFLLDEKQQEAALLDNYLLRSGTEVPTTSDFLARNSQDMKSWLDNTSNWFEGYMARVSGWYKKRSHTNIFWWSLLLVVFFNINLFTFVSDLFENQVLRDFWVEKAITYTEDGKQELKLEEAMNPLKNLFSFQMPKPSEVVDNFLGWFVTILAISLGAPFWFDILCKTVNLRAAGKKSGDGQSP